MNRGKAVEELEQRLSETERSLSVAIARIEAYRCREKLLLRDHEAIRLRARQAGLDLSPPPQQPGNGVAPIEQAAMAAARAGAAAGPSHLALTALNEVHPLILHTPRAKVPGTLLVAGNDLHFVETHARVSATDYLGIRSVKEAGGGHLQEASATEDGPRESSPQPGSRGGVLSGAATWLAQKVRTSGSGSGEAEETASSGGGGDGSGVGIGLTNIMTTIMHSLDDDDSASGYESTESGPDVAPAAGPEAAADAAIARGRTPYRGPSDPAGPQLWEIAWADSLGHMQALQFEAGLPARAFIAKQAQRWSTAAAGRGAQPPLSATAFAAWSRCITSAGAQPLQACGGCQAALPAAPPEVTASEDGRRLSARVFSALDLELAAPDHMRPTDVAPVMSERSGIVTPEQARALAGALPARFRMHSWHLQYSTERHGISLKTLYRRGLATPTLLIIRDSAGFVFGAFTGEAWRVATRYYGSGETFVFQLQPHRVAWRWRRPANDERNDYFMFGTPESLAVGGGGHFAIFLAQDLLQGSSGISTTFGNPCLAGSSDFTVGQLELWSLSRL